MAASFPATHFILSWPRLPFSLDFDEPLLVLGLDGFAFVVRLITLPGGTHGDSAKASLWCPGCRPPCLLLPDFAPAGAPGAEPREALPMAQCPPSSCTSLCGFNDPV